jgi:acetyl-CoA carboxylase biotin carboxyl carrier protein
LNEKYIKKLIRLVEESDVESLEVSSWGRKVKIIQKMANSTNGSTNGHSTHPVLSQPITIQAETPAVAPINAEKQATPENNQTVDKSKLVPVTSPMVGTFYSAPSPDVDSYVGLNEQVRAGQVVCIVEAMKLMNEIESEVSGRVVEILAENGKPVEFGQDLFLIDPS